MPGLALVVDDSMVIRHTVCRFLEDRGYAVESAANGHEALEVIARAHPVLLITDMQMPAMSGSELISALKANPDTATIPIVIITSHSSGLANSEKRAEFIIFKDIDVQEQLEKALAAVAQQNAAKAQSSGK